MDHHTLEQIFSYHRPTESQIPKYERLRAGALIFAQLIDDLVPDCADKPAAIRKVREAVMTANAGIAISG